MRKRKIIFSKFAAVILAAAALFWSFHQRDTLLPALGRAVRRAGIAGVMSILPEGGARKLTAQFSQNVTANAEVKSEAPQSSRPAVSRESPKEQESVSSAAASSAKETPSYVAPPKGAKTGKVIEKQFTNSGASVSYKNIFLSNKTGVEINIEKEYNTAPNVKIKKNGDPMVLIIHTHATEAYMPYDYGYFIDGQATRTTKETENMISVGAVIAKQLNDAGIVTIQDKTLHDHPTYTGGYERSEKTVRKYLKEYPSIQVVLDIHRDAITYDNKDKAKPTVVINGKKAAQIMICSAREGNGFTNFPNWRQNLRFALRIQEAVEKDNPGLARPIYHLYRRYVEHLLPGSLLIEIGSEGNTLEEAKYTAELLGKSLAGLLETLK